MISVPKITMGYQMAVEYDWTNKIYTQNTTQEIADSLYKGIEAECVYACKNNYSPEIHVNCLQNMAGQVIAECKVTCNGDQSECRFFRQR